MKKVITTRWNWKVLLMSLLANMTAISITAVLIPGIVVQIQRLYFIALLAIVLGLLNTFIKPILQILTIRLLFITYGLILVVTNAIILLLLDRIFDSFTVENLWSAIIGAILISLISAFLDYLLGVNPPIGYQQVIEEQEAAHGQA